MKMCNESDKCKTCEARELCEAFENLVNIVEHYKPTPKADADIKNDAEEYISHMAFALNDKAAIELFKLLDFESFHGFVLASISTVADLYISWQAKCEEIDRLKVQLEAQEVIHHG